MTKDIQDMADRGLSGDNHLDRMVKAAAEEIMALLELRELSDTVFGEGN